MKISRTQLQKLISEAICESNSILLESPGDPIVGQEQEGSYTKDPKEYEGERTKRDLYHLSAQAQQLHDMFADGDSLDAEVRDKISSAAKSIEEAFKAITYDKQNPRGR
tara:strand:- start:24 stop:350 length:327 start_codon:yes stop_codon:yes gene_type:complete